MITSWIACYYESKVFNSGDRRVIRLKNKDKKMNEDMIFERVAQKNGVSPEEVRSNIQAII